MVEVEEMVEWGSEAGRSVGTGGSRRGRGGGGVTGSMIREKGGEMVDGLMMMMILMMRLMVVEEISFLTSLGLYIETSFKGVEPSGASERNNFFLVERSTCLSPYLYLTLPTLFTNDIP